MKTTLSGVLLASGLSLAAPALAAPGQCSMTGFSDFACDVSVDGGGLTFGLPDGTGLVFAHLADGEGLGYRVTSDAEPGRRPEELGMFAPIEDRPGCWYGAEDDITFCAAIAQ